MKRLLPLFIAVAGAVCAQTISGISPSSAVAGGPGFTLTINGQFFAGVASTVSWTFGSSTTSLTVNSASPTQITATVPASLIATPGTASVQVSQLGQNSNAATFTITAPAATITSISPASALVNSPAFTLTVNGANFSGCPPSLDCVTSAVYWNTTPLSTTFISSTQLTAQVPASLLTAPGNASITAVTGSQTSNAATFTVFAVAPPTLTSISPSSVAAGGPAFTLTANGSNYQSNSVIEWNGATLTTTFVSTSQLTATVPANLIAQPATVSIVVATLNAGASAPLSLTITAASLSLTSITPNSAPAGSLGLTLTVNGSGFLIRQSQVTWNGTALATTYISGTQLSATVPASLLTTPGTAQVGVTNIGQTASGTLPFTITSTTVTLTSLSPSSAVAGSSGIILSVLGSNFQQSSVVNWNGIPLATSFGVLGYGSQLAATVPANLLTQPNTTASITVSTPGSALSNALPFSVTYPQIVLTSITPNTAPAGSPALTLTVNGSGFFNGLTNVTWNGTTLATTYLSSTQLTASVPASLLTTAGTAQVGVANPNQSPPAALTFTITNATPTLTSINPSSAVAGSAAFTMTLNGTNFQQSSRVNWNSTALNTSFVSATQLLADVPASLIAQPNVTASVTVVTPNQATSNALSFAVTYPAITLTSISPTSAAAGSPALALTVNGSGFFSGLTNVTWNGTALTTTYVSATQLTAAVPATLLATVGTAQVDVANPNQTPPAAVTFTITAALTLTSISPTSANAGGPGFSLTLNGAGFASTAAVLWNGSPLATTFVSATQLTAAVPSTLIASPGAATVAVSSGGLTSNTLSFAINALTPTLTSVTPSSATAGDPDTTITVSGTNFLAQTVVQWNGAPLATTAGTATQLTAVVPARLLASAGSADVTAMNPSNLVSNALAFTINPKPVLTLTTLSQTLATAGDAAFTLTINGTAFTSASQVRWSGTSLTTAFISATQLIAAVPANLLTTPGTYNVTVANPDGVSNSLAFTVNLPPPPALRLTAPATTTAAQQPTVDFGLNAAYPIPLSGTVTLTFAPDAVAPSDDPAIQFASGGRSMNFTVNANSTTLPPLLLQTGTVAGTITLGVKLTAAGTDVTPSGSTATIRIARSAPVIRTVTISRSANTIEVDVIGYSTPRDMTQATFHFNAAPGAQLALTDVTVPLTSLFSAWYQSTGSTQFGSQFTYAQPFTVSSDTSAITSVTVTLANSAGNSASATTN